MLYLLINIVVLLYSLYACLAGISGTLWMVVMLVEITIAWLIILKHWITEWSSPDQYGFADKRRGLLQLAGIPLGVIVWNSWLIMGACALVGGDNIGTFFAAITVVPCIFAVLPTVVYSLNALDGWSYAYSNEVDYMQAVAAHEQAVADGTNIVFLPRQGTIYGHEFVDDTGIPNDWD